MSTAIEDNLTQSVRQYAFEEARKEHSNYFRALEQHPRTLVGKQVPSMTGDGMETLRDTQDARDWQDAVKALLIEEISERAEKRLSEAAPFLETIHGSIELFQNNPDLIPGTRTFNRDLADALAESAKPYEVRIDGKLQGYSIPVQPIINALRKQMKPAAPAAPARGRPPGSTNRPQPEAPQAAISSKAGSSGEVEDFSTLFGTIGLPHLRI